MDRVAAVEWLVAIFAPVFVALVAVWLESRVRRWWTGRAQVSGVSLPLPERDGDVW